MKFILVIISAIVLISCDRDKALKKTESEQQLTRLSSSNSSRYLSQLTEMEFVNKVVDLGQINECDTTLIGQYIFRNTGKDTLLIEYVNPECSCTGFEFTKDKIAPGDDGYVLLSFNTKDRIGMQKLYTIVKANTESKFYKLTLKLRIIPDEKKN